MVKTFCNICGKEFKSIQKVKQINGVVYTVYVSAAAKTGKDNRWGEEICFDCKMGILKTGIEDNQ